MEESTQLATLEQDRPLTPAQIHTQVQVIQAVLASEMVSGVHYGTIPGCGDKPALLKAGAEKLCMTFRLAPKYETEDLGENGEIRVRVRAKLYSMQHGVFVAEGIGEASSLEDKYAWESPRSQAHWDATPADRRRIKYGRDKQGNPSESQQIRANVADRANTILKMGKKRALVDAVLTATAASDMFSQDLDEDDVANMAREHSEKPTQTAQAAPRSANPEPRIPYGPAKGKKLSEADAAHLRGFLEGKRESIAAARQRPEYAQSDAMLMAAIESELAKRPPEQPATPDNSEARGEFTNEAWEAFCSTAAEQFPDQLAALLDEKKIKALPKVKPEYRWEIYDALQAKLQDNQ